MLRPSGQTAEWRKIGRQDECRIVLEDGQDIAVAGNRVISLLDPCVVVRSVPFVYWNASVCACVLDYFVWKLDSGLWSFLCSWLQMKIKC